MAGLTERFQILLSQQERALLEEMAAQRGMSAAEVLRDSLRRVYRPAAALTPLQALLRLQQRPRLDGAELQKLRAAFVSE